MGNISAGGLNAIFIKKYQEWYICKHTHNYRSEIEKRKKNTF